MKFTNQLGLLSIVFFVSQANAQTLSVREWNPFAGGAQKQAQAQEKARAERADLNNRLNEKIDPIKRLSQEQADLYRLDPWTREETKRSVHNNASSIMNAIKEVETRTRTPMSRVEKANFAKEYTIVKKMSYPQHVLENLSSRHMIATDEEIKEALSSRAYKAEQKSIFETKHASNLQDDVNAAMRNSYLHLDNPTDVAKVMKNSLAKTEESYEFKFGRKMPQVERQKYIEVMAKHFKAGGRVPAKVIGTAISLLAGASVMAAESANNEASAGNPPKSVSPSNLGTAKSWARPSGGGTAGVQ